MQWSEGNKQQIDTIFCQANDHNYPWYKPAAGIGVWPILVDQYSLR